MTKISSITTALVLVLFLFALANSAVLAADIIFSDDFEDGNYSGWSTFGSVSINSWHAIGAYSVRLRATGRIWRTVSTAGYSDVTVEWYWAAGSLESSDHCYAEANTGSGWTIIDQLDNGEDDYTFRPGSASPSGADDNAGFRIRFRASGSYGDYCFVDNVVVTSGMDTANNWIYAAGMDSFSFYAVAGDAEAVPEPMSVTFFGTGVVGVVGFVLRRRAGR